MRRKAGAWLTLFLCCLVFSSYSLARHRPCPLPGPIPPGDEAVCEDGRWLNDPEHNIPALGQWGFVLFSVLLLAGGVYLLTRRRRSEDSST